MRYFWSIFSFIWTEYWDLRSKLRIQSEYRKIRTRNHSVFGHFSCNVRNCALLGGYHYALRNLVYFFQNTRFDQQEKCCRFIRRMLTFDKFLRTPSLTEHPRWLLLYSSKKIDFICADLWILWKITFKVGIYLFKVNNGNTGTKREIFSNLLIKTPDLMSLLLTLHKLHALFSCFHCWLWTSKYHIG